MYYKTSKEQLEKELVELEVQCDFLRHRINRRKAEETVLENGIKRDDEDFEFEVEMEMDRLWEEEWDWDRRRFEERMCVEMMREEEGEEFLKAGEKKK